MQWTTRGLWYLDLTHLFVLCCGWCCCRAGLASAGRVGSVAGRPSLPLSRRSHAGRAGGRPACRRGRVSTRPLVSSSGAQRRGKEHLSTVIVMLVRSCAAFSFSCAPLRESSRYAMPDSREYRVRFARSRIESNRKRIESPLRSVCIRLQYNSTHLIVRGHLAFSFGACRARGQ